MRGKFLGDQSENPFENSVKDISMTAICRTIEIDLQEMLGEKLYPVKSNTLETSLCECLGLFYY